MDRHRNVVDRIRHLIIKMSLLLIFIYVICGAYLLLNLKHDIHILQQNSYRISRYWSWLEQGHFLGASRLVDMALIFLLLSTLLTPAMCALLTACVCLFKIYRILTARFKKPLVFTRRVWRIYSVAGGLSLAIFLGCVAAFGFSGDMVGYYSGPNFVLSVLLLEAIVSWSFVIAAVWLLRPVESSINRKYWNEAKSILKGMPELKVIGITGSYGKTSTKHYLHTILSEQFETLMTPGSYNTPMGVIRTVREMMKPYTEIFICEMGAKQKGDIKEICDLVEPDCGIITAVGPMHLETFGSIENVRDTKFELADAVPANGFVVINDDFAMSASREVDNTECIRYAISKPGAADYRADNIEYSTDGTHFMVLKPNGERLSFTTRLVGESNVSNLLAAIIVALKLGMSEEAIQLGVGRIQQVEHRLSMKRTPGGVTIIDDAFNSNPVGSKMALEVLGSFKGGKRICVTPGMVELGSRRDELNEKLGVHIGENADVAIIVNEYNRESLTRGILSTAFNKKNLYQVADFNEAQKILSSILSPGDTVLYENDLPDTFK